MDKNKKVVELNHETAAKVANLLGLDEAIFAAENVANGEPQSERDGQFHMTMTEHDLGSWTRCRLSCYACCTAIRSEILPALNHPEACIERIYRIQSQIWETISLIVLCFGSSGDISKNPSKEPFPESHLDAIKRLSAAMALLDDAAKCYYDERSRGSTINQMGKPIGSALNSCDLAGRKFEPKLT